VADEHPCRKNRDSALAADGLADEEGARKDEHRDHTPSGIQPLPLGIRRQILRVPFPGGNATKG
jgi:hypothetical protein